VNRFIEKVKIYNEKLGFKVKIAKIEVAKMVIRG